MLVVGTEVAPVLVTSICAAAVALLFLRAAVLVPGLG